MVDSKAIGKVHVIFDHPSYLERKVNVSDFLKQERLLHKAFEHNLSVFQKSVKFFKNPFYAKQFIFSLVTRENRYS